MNQARNDEFGHRFVGQDMQFLGGERNFWR
jgi:hypothetical protein